MKLTPDFTAVASAFSRWSWAARHFIGWKPMLPQQSVMFRSLLSALVLLCFAPSVWSQAPAGQFQVTKITKNFITSPQFTYTGAEQFAANQRDRWLEVEVEFKSTAEFTDELTLRYFILVNGKLLTGEVTHTNIIGGHESRSVMYVPPQALARVMGNRPVAPNSVQNIAVQIVQQGTVKDETNLVRVPAQWYKELPALAGLVLNKNETPFAPLYWDRYEQIKAASTGR
jgi:hypothetical protein